MAKPLHVLVLENSAKDAELLIRELRRAGFDTKWRRAATEAEYLRQLERPTDLILADYSLPQFNAPRALQLLKKRGLSIPFVIVSDSIGEEAAVDCIKSGAADHLQKHRLARLGPAVAQALDRKRRREDKLPPRPVTRESEPTLTSLIGNLPGMVYRSLPEPLWTFTYTSEGCLPLTGYQATDFTERTIHYREIIHEDDLDLVVQAKKAALQARESFQIEYRIITAAGEEKWAWERGRGVYASNGRMLHVEGFITDISERKLAEDGLTQQRILLETILGQAADGIVVCDIDGNLTFINAAARRIAQVDAEDSPADPTTDLWGALHDQDGVRLPFDQWPLPKALCGKITVGQELRLVRPDGSHSDLLVSSAPLRNADRVIVGGVATFVDITSRKAAEVSFAELARQHQLILESAGEGIYGLDMEGNTTFVNPAAAAMIGYAIDELIGKPQHRICHHSRVDGSPYPREECPIYAAFKDGQVHHVDSEVFWRKDGTSFPVSYTSTPIKDKDANLIGAVVTFRDVTEQRRLAEQLRQAAKMDAVGQLAGGVAHDFNNLLTIICAYTQVLTTRHGLDEQVRGHLGEINAAAQRAAGLTSQLLTFSRQEITQPIDVNLNEAVSTCTNMLERILGEDVVLQTKLAREIGLLRIDPVQLEQVIMNLVINARDAMPEGGTLTIETAKAELPVGGPQQGSSNGRGAVQLSVRDTGHGMDEKTRTRIFEPFFTTKEQGKGTGLGLATVYGIVMENNGTIAVESTVGKGTCFMIRFPSIEEKKRREKSTQHVSALTEGTETILLVEDDAHLRKVVRQVLSEAGYQVLEAANGEQAYQLCDSHGGPIHALLTDVVMPGINGRRLSEVLVALRPKLKVLFMSGYSDDIILRHGIRQGSAAFIRKPFNGDSLTSTLRELLTPPSE